MESDAEKMVGESRDSFTKSAFDEMMRDFIEMYKALPELWNKHHPGYSDQTRRNAAVDKLIPILAQIKPDAHRTDVRRKINTIRSNYRKELRRVAAARISGDENFIPKSWLYHALDFLQNYDNKTDTFVEFSGQTSNVNRYYFDESSYRNEEESNSSIDVKNDNFTFDDDGEHEDDQMSSSSSNVIKPARKKQKLSFKQEQITSTSLPIKTHSSSSDFQSKNHPTIAKVWGEKLLELDPLQRLFAEKAINDVLFEATLGNLSRDSVKIVQS